MEPEEPPRTRAARRPRLGLPRAALFAVVTLASACGEAREALPRPPEPPPPGPPWFAEDHAAAGLDFVHVSGAGSESLHFPEIMGGGVALIDVEGDGDLDVYFVQSGKLLKREATASNRLYRNDGTARFADATDETATGDHGYGMGVATGDVDGDGRTDLYVTNVGANALLVNRPTGPFEDRTQTAGVGHASWSTSAAFADLNADGHLDLFVCNYVYWSPESELRCTSPAGLPDYCSPNSYNAPLADTLYLNRNDGSFEDASVRCGITSRKGNGLGVVVGDFDDDGKPDVFVANDQTENHLWRNEGSERFREVGAEWGCAVDAHGEPKAGMGTVCEDFDDDGDLDLLVVNLRAQADSFYRNEGAYFRDRTAFVGLGSAPRPFTRFGVGAVDFDNDGWLDLYQANGRVARLVESEPRSTDPYAEPNLLLAGGPGGRWEPLAPEGGVVPPLVHTSRGAAFGDLDGDGGVDVVVVNRDAAPYLLRNQVSGRGHWIRFRVLDAHGAPALGARVDVELGERTLRREVRSAYSYAAASEPVVHVGLGTSKRVAGIRVRWPDGTRGEFGPFDADQEIAIRPPSEVRR